MKLIKTMNIPVIEFMDSYADHTEELVKTHKVRDIYLLKYLLQQKERRDVNEDRI